MMLIDKKNLCVLILVCMNFHSCKANDDGVEFKAVRNKRISNIQKCNFTNVINVASKAARLVVNAAVGNPIGIASGTIGLLWSIVGPHILPTACDIEQKLNDILNKIDKINNDLKAIKNSIHCQPILNAYTDIHLKMRHILELFSVYDPSDANKEKAMANIIKACEPVDITKMYTNFKFYSEPEKVQETFKYCLEYQSPKVEKWTEEIQQMAGIFFFVVIGCKKALNSRATLNLSLFLDTTEHYLKYYTETMLPQWFFNDNEIGLKHQVKQSAEKNQKALDMSTELSNLYKFHKWDVIVYKKSIFKFFQIKDTCYDNPNSFDCGSICHLTRKKDINKDENVMVAWCMSDIKINTTVEHSNCNMKLDYSSFKQIVADNPNDLNYVVVTNKDLKLDYSLNLPTKEMEINKCFMEKFKEFTLRHAFVSTIGHTTPVKSTPQPFQNAFII